MPWTIIEDFIAEPDAPKPSNRNAVGVVGPRGTKLTAAQIIGHPETRRFRIRDDDGELYYEGMTVVTAADGAEAEFHPLWDFGTPNAGATSIEYQQPDGTWEPL